MRPYLPTRLLASTASNLAIAPLCFKSTSHRPRQPSGRHVRFAVVAQTRSPMANYHSWRARLYVEIATSTSKDTAPTRSHLRACQFLCPRTISATGTFPAV
jgi:hypothetical protein